MRDSCEIFNGRYLRTPLGTTAPASSLEDKSREKNNGVFQNNPIWVQEKSGQWVIEHSSALNQSIILGSIATMSMGTKDQSFTCWFKMTEAGFVANRYLCRCGGGAANGGYLLQINAATTCYISFNDGTAGNIVKSFTIPTPFDSRYHQIVLTMNRDSLALAYLDGVVSTTAGLDISGKQAFITNGENFYLGFVATSLYGRMSKARVVNRVYNPDEIMRMYINEAPLFGIGV